MEIGDGGDSSDDLARWRSQRAGSQFGAPAVDVDDDRMIGGRREPVDGDGARPSGMLRPRLEIADRDPELTRGQIAPADLDARGVGGPHLER